MPISQCSSAEGADSDGRTLLSLLSVGQKTPQLLGHLEKVVLTFYHCCLADTVDQPPLAIDDIEVGRFGLAMRSFSLIDTVLCYWYDHCGRVFLLGQQDCHWLQ